MPAGPDAALDEAVAQQRAKLWPWRAHQPRLTDDDVMRPADFHERVRDPQFNYEDGILAGRLSAQAVLRRNAC